MKNNKLKYWIENELLLPSPINQIILPISGKTALIKRDDLIHPILSGNKFRKIIGFLYQYFEEGKSEIESGGSLHSNFVHALAYTCFKLKIKCKFYLYGHPKDESFLIKDISNWGISYEIVSRQNYREYTTLNYKDSPSILYIPEGGNAEQAEFGVEKLAEEIGEKYKFENLNIALPIGTGTMLKHLQQKMSMSTFYTVCPVKSQTLVLSESKNSISIKEPIHFAFGGYSKEMLEYIDQFYKINGIWLDPIYTGRLALALDHNFHLIDSKKETIILHTGGLQSWRFYLKRWPNAEYIINIEELKKMIKLNFN
ncbi:MAG: hypothetical protein IPH93_11380 [Saprospiraceae bacterium]|nr:hypothetical protein [Saprospiraceae bacterium]MBK7812193.1 hypothetical protein [Saprospiraceae bacterium]MBK9632589.1 hypothetical protein [Saprospiraceae bacterium]